MAHQGVGTLRYKNYGDRKDDRGVPLWTRVEEQSQAGVTRRLADEKVGRAMARVTFIESQIKALDAPSLRGARAKATRKVNRMLGDLGGVDPAELARAICRRP